MIVPPAHSAGYPDHNIQMIIPYVAGATGDITARLLIEEMQKSLGVKIIPNNKPGAASVLGTDAAVRSKKDGYTLLYSSASAIIYAPITSPDVVHYNAFKDLEPLGFHYWFPQGIGVRSDAPWNSFTELIDYAKKNPGKLRVSTVGVSSTPHIMLEMIQDITGAKFTHVPFEGGESVITALLGNHVEVCCDGYAKFKPHTDAGKLKILLISKKLPFAPEYTDDSRGGLQKRDTPRHLVRHVRPCRHPGGCEKSSDPCGRESGEGDKSKNRPDGFHRRVQNSGRNHEAAGRRI